MGSLPGRSFLRGQFHLGTDHPLRPSLARLSVAKIMKSLFSAATALSSPLLPPGPAAEQGVTPQLLSSHQAFAPDGRPIPEVSSAALPFCLALLEGLRYRRLQPRFCPPGPRGAVSRE